MKSFWDEIVLIKTQLQLQDIKQEEDTNQQPNDTSNEQQFINLRSNSENQQIEFLKTQEINNFEYGQSDQGGLQKKFKKDKTDLIPYKSQDNKRRTISLEFQIQEGRKYIDEFLCSEFLIGSKQKCETQDLLNQILEKQQRIHPFIFNNEIKQIQNLLKEKTRILDQIIYIQQNQQYDPKIIQFNHLIDFNPENDNLILIQKIMHESEEFTKRFSETLISKIGTSFCKGIKSNQFLPLNLSITINTIRVLEQSAFKQVNNFLPQYWTLQFEWRLGMQQLIFNPKKIKEIASYISQFEPSYVQLLNLQENDPKKFRSLKNLEKDSIENSLISMMISDIGWAYNHDISDATLLNTKIINYEITKQYLSSFFMPITILSGIPILKIGKNYATSEEQLKTKLIKSIKKSEFGQIMNINNYFEANTVLNYPEQRIKARINKKIEIYMDFVSKRFQVNMKENEEINEIKDITLENIKFV